MGLPAESDFRSHDQDLALADVGLGDGRRAVEIFLPKGPAAVERVGSVERRDFRHALLVLV